MISPQGILANCWQAQIAHVNASKWAWVVLHDFGIAGFLLLVFCFALSAGGGRAILGQGSQVYLLDKIGKRHASQFFHHSSLFPFISLLKWLVFRISSPL